MPTDPRSPDIVVVVLDCVTSREFDLATSAGTGPLSELRSESVRFPRAAAVAPWTLPSHASLFTGLYPWEHGCHGKGVLQLPALVERVPQWLQRTGYRTYSVSGNPLVGSNYGLIDGFDRAAWGEWWERAFRVLAAPPNRHEGPAAPPREYHPPGRRRRAASLLTVAAQRAPFALAASGSLLRRLKRIAREEPGAMNLWIEPTVRSWLGESASAVPSFLFVNFIDAHEPYLTLPAGAAGLIERWRNLGIPQDSLALLSEPSPLGTEDQRRLRAMYRASVGRLVTRVGRLVRFLQDRGRWDDTLFILTSDHGQAFGEGGVVWHGLRPDEAELRVPLWVKWPRGERPAPEGAGWASPLDVAATVLEAVGRPRARPAHSFPLLELAVGPRPEPLLAVSDGVTWNGPLCARLSTARVAELDRLYGVAYWGDRKVVCDISAHRTQVFDLSADPECLQDLARTDAGPLEAAAIQARQAGSALLERPAVAGEPGVEGRLRAWGYM